MPQTVHHIQNMQNIAKSAINKRNLTWGRTLATVHERLALELRAVFGRAENQTIPIGMKKAPRTTPARFTLEAVHLLQEIADNSKLRTIESIKTYTTSIGQPVDDKMAHRLFMALVKAIPMGGEVEVFTKGDRHKIKSRRISNCGVQVYQEASVKTLAGLTYGLGVYAVKDTFPLREMRG